MAAVKLYGMWASPFAFRVKLALKLKGVEYEYVEEDLFNKSPLLLKYNPVYKKIPVLVHDEKPVVESLVIIEYIDETWKHNPIFPEDPYERATTLFWAKFVEEKCGPAVFSTFSKVGEEQQKAMTEAKENLKTLEEYLRGKKFFGGETIGFVDIAASWLANWIPIIEEIIGMKIVEEENLPLISNWFETIQDLDIVKEHLPPRDKLVALEKDYRQQLIGSSA